MLEAMGVTACDDDTLRNEVVARSRWLREGAVLDAPPKKGSLGAREPRATKLDRSSACRASAAVNAAWIVASGSMSDNGTTTPFVSGTRGDLSCARASLSPSAVAGSSASTAHRGDAPGEAGGTDSARRCARAADDSKERCVRKLAPERKDKAGDECVGSVSVTMGPDRCPSAIVSVSEEAHSEDPQETEGKRRAERTQDSSPPVPSQPDRVPPPVPQPAIIDDPPRPLDPGALFCAQVRRVHEGRARRPEAGPRGEERVREGAEEGWVRAREVGKGDGGRAVRSGGRERRGRGHGREGAVCDARRRRGCWGAQARRA